MCGIIGYTGASTAAPLLRKGLKRLEYRGYDSVGICTLSPSGITVKKGVGKVDEVHAKLDLENLPGTTGCGHVRWATHGGVTQENAHPQTSCDFKIATVHNGILENFSEIKEALANEGHIFRSQTDSEVIAHLIEKYAKRMPFREAVFKAASELKGSFAFVAMSTSEPGTLIGARKESPLVVGLAKDGVFIASDVLPFLEYTKKAVFLEDGEAVVATKAGAKFYDYYKSAQIRKNPTEIKWDISDAGKNGLPHYMLKEIYDQPLMLRHTLRQDREKLQKVSHILNAAPRVCIVACGTSRHAALVGRYVISEIAGKYCEVYMASEFQYFVDKLGKDTIIIAVSQSGETADVLVPVRLAKRNGCRVISLVNVVGSSLDRESDISLYLNCGPEISVASTKAFTCQVALFFLLAYTMAYEYDSGVKLLEEIPEKIEQTIKNTERTIKLLAPILKAKPDIYYIARGENFAVATEGALKMKEISYIHAEGMPAGELKHGTLALIMKDTPIVVICPHDKTYEETVANIVEARARGAYVIGISDEQCRYFDQWLEIPQVDYIFYPLLANIPCQLLAYYVAVARGNDVDQPRNLAKSVTVK